MIPAYKYAASQYKAIRSFKKDNTTTQQYDKLNEKKKTIVLEVGSTFWYIFGMKHV